MNTGSSKPKFLLLVLLVLAFFYWDENFRGDEAPSLDLQNSIFENSYLTSADGDRIYSYCFGSGGGAERGHPCIYIVNYYQDYSESADESCYVLSYLPEANYGQTFEEIPENRRYFPFTSTPFEARVCGKFQLWDGSERGDGRRIDIWEYETDTYPSEIISADLKSRGYEW